MPGIFNRGIFNDGIFNTNVVAETQSSGGYDYGERYRTRQEISLDRKRFGITDDVASAIAVVAASQAARLEQDKQKQFEELSRELELRNIAWETIYLEKLAAERERLIGLEIADLLRRRMQDDELLMLMLMAAAALNLTGSNNESKHSQKLVSANKRGRLCT